MKRGKGIRADLLGYCSFCRIPGNVPNAFGILSRVTFLFYYIKIFFSLRYLNYLPLNLRIFVSKSIVKRTSHAIFSKLLINTVLWSEEFRDCITMSKRPSVFSCKESEPMTSSKDKDRNTAEMYPGNCVKFNGEQRRKWKSWITIKWNTLQRENEIIFNALLSITLSINIDTIIIRNE